MLKPVSNDLANTALSEKSNNKIAYSMLYI